MARLESASRLRWPRRIIVSTTSLRNRLAAAPSPSSPVRSRYSQAIWNESSSSWESEPVMSKKPTRTVRVPCRLRFAACAWMRSAEPPPRCPLRRWRFGGWTGQSRCARQAPGETACVSRGLRRRTIRLRPPSVRGPQAAHGELDSTVPQFAPAFDFAHVGSRGILLQKRSRLRTGFFARTSKLFPHETVRRIRSPGHTVGKVPRSKRHAANSNK
jgi:hypothetical protein